MSVMLAKKNKRARTAPGTCLIILSHLGFGHLVGALDGCELGVLLGGQLGTQSTAIQLVVPPVPFTTSHSARLGQGVATCETKVSGYGQYPNTIPHMRLSESAFVGPHPLV